MAPRVFVSFAVEDANLRDLLVGQTRNSGFSNSVTDYSVRIAWKEKWKTNCRPRIKRCKGLIGIITRNTPKADGQIWEIECAVEEDIPIFLIHGHSDAASRISRVPSAIRNRRLHNWTHDNINNFLNRIKNM